MTIDQIQAIVQNAAFPGAGAPVDLVETHISWVILTPDFAFKIKKPLNLGFLDFSSLEKRRFYCNEELRLNRRLAPDMYLAVLPIGQAQIGTAELPILDYALQMRRIDNRKQMDRLLQKNQVSAAQMEQLALLLADFHQKTVLPPDPDFDPGVFWADFAELYQLLPDIEQQLGAEAARQFRSGQIFLPEFLEQHRERLTERRQNGFWVDGHGDLHSRNIFLLESGPIVFDCIEFSAHFRQSDILNELAFLCMDLEAEAQPALADAFLKAYCRHWDLFPKAEDRLLLLFFKTYRANVRLKVSLLELRQHRTPELVEQVRKYWELMAAYMRALQSA